MIKLVHIVHKSFPQIPTLFLHENYCMSYLYELHFSQFLDYRTQAGYKMLKKEVLTLSTLPTYNLTLSSFSKCQWFST